MPKRVRDHTLFRASQQLVELLQISASYKRREGKEKGKGKGKGKEKDKGRQRQRPKGRQRRLTRTQ